MHMRIFILKMPVFAFLMHMIMCIIRLKPIKSWKYFFVVHNFSRILYLIAVSNVNYDRATNMYLLMYYVTCVFFITSVDI